MAKNTISVDLPAYTRLAAARRRPNESFSSVIRREEWPASGTRGSDLLWIAAIAKEHRLSIVSRDNHFDSVKGVRRITW
jgi:predicted nucleic acid-binding protein